MRLRITVHAGSMATRPANALDLLWQRLGADHDGASFVKVGPDEIGATLGHNVPAMAGERLETERRALLEIVSDLCERAPELELDWFAVGFTSKQ